MSAQIWLRKTKTSWMLMVVKTTINNNINNSCYNNCIFYGGIKYECDSITISLCPDYETKSYSRLNLTFHFE